MGFEPGDVLGFLEYEQTEYKRQARYKVFVTSNYPEKEPVVNLEWIIEKGKLSPCLFPRLDRTHALELAVMLFKFATDEESEQAINGT